ncbi:peptide/nickel transport system substrate-binding protein [Pseudonocardia hierapolitana]|uniref:Peptide/nickel transport system substrate-binding protein n=1 Tax=Pseudonocardia hierapolitana TaxID=1128676 RepID=A0A561SPP1_9PSEU|nr:ABC transporter substrate-binding protein [Pseudonocardia hierapolitana]TWF76824.1 peptide/nickel transport system substrate-binding protein [Pseudonocardia hierapolitana]
MQSQSVPRRWLSLLAVPLFLAACGTPESPPPEDAVVRVVTPYTVRSLDPIKQGLWSPEWGYGELLMRATDDGRVEPWLLESLEPESPTSWQLRLRPNIRFANGNPLTAAGLAAVVDRHLAENARVGESLPGADVQVLDDRTLRLTTARPVANLPHLLADEQGISVFDAAATEPSGDIYTGPFRVRSLSAEELVLERNPNYWGGEVRLDEARIRFVPDPQARVLAVRSGEADIALYPPTEALAQFTNGSGPSVAVAAQPLQHLRAIPNLRKAPMNDLAARQAFALGVDYRQLAEDVLGVPYRAPDGLFPDVVDYALPTQRTDAAEAARVLDAAGWAPGPDGIRQRDGVRLAVTVLTYGSQPDTRTVAVAIQSQLRPLGMEVTIASVDDNYAAMRDPAGWDVGLSFDGTLGYTYDPIGPLRSFLTSGAQRNFGGVADPELDTLVAEMEATPDEAARRPLLERAQQIIAANRYVVIVAQRSSPAIVAETFAGYLPSSVLHHISAQT